MLVGKMLGQSRCQPGFLCRRQWQSKHRFAACCIGRLGGLRNIEKAHSFQGTMQEGSAKSVPTRWDMS